MKVLQTLGRHKTQEGIFQYRRTADGVYIDASIGQAKSLNPSDVVLTHDEWTAILVALGAASGETFRLTRTNTPDAPQQSLYDTIFSAVQKPSKGWQWNDSWLAYVSAILEHEGSVDHYGGSLGPGAGAPIILARDS